METITRLAVAATLLALAAAPAARAETIEEIVALVDGDIVTSSEYEAEEQAMMQEVYRRYTGEQLDQAVAQVKRTLLMDLIDRKILVHRAGRMFDTDRMADAFYQSFREQQQIQDEEEFLQSLANMGMNVEDVKARLVQMLAPDEVIRYEVSSRVSVADHEVESYFDAHPEEFRYDDEVTLREIILLADSDEKRAERREEARRLRERLTPENFGELAGETSDAGTKDNGGSLGTVRRGDLSEDLEAIAFGLGTGEISEVLERPYGFHILFAEQARVGAQKTIDDVREELRARLEDERYSERLQEFMTKARSESEWCVKTKFIDRLPERYDDQACKEM